jgi:hypothetical protein
MSIFEYHTDEARRVILALLKAECFKKKEIGCDVNVFTEMPEDFYKEAYQVPTGSVLVLKIRSLESFPMNYGEISLYKLRGKLFVTEQNNSPLFFYYRKKDLTNFRF